jgi:hypothetical protein
MFTTLKVQPNPYELYILFDNLNKLWTIPTTWKHQPVFTCLFQAIELTLRIADDVLNDSRASGFQERRIQRLSDNLIRQMLVGEKLLSTVDVPPTDLLSKSKNVCSSGFAVLERLEPKRVQRLTDQFYDSFKTLPFAIGIEPQLNAIRKQFRLQPKSLHQECMLDYNALVRPQLLADIREVQVQNQEDHTFSTVHQSIECWIYIAHFYLREACACAKEYSWDKAATYTEYASECVNVAIDQSQLLDLMTLADFHYLRVLLREASGAQSQSVRQLPSQGRAIFEQLNNALRVADVDLVHVLDHPSLYPSQYALVRSLSRFSKHIQDFLFRHYLLVLSVAGSNSYGSLGYKINSMVERAAQPIFPEIDQANHDLLMITNFRYGQQSGRLIMEKEIAAGYNPYNLVPISGIEDPDFILARITEYFEYIHVRNGEAWVALYDDKIGQFCDCLGSKPYFGQAKLRVFINAMFDTFASINTRFWNPRIYQNKAQIDWQFDTVSYNGIQVTFKGTEEFVFNEDGRIVNAIAHWEPNDVAKQLWPTKFRKRRVTGGCPFVKRNSV